MKRLFKRRKEIVENDEIPVKKTSKREIKPLVVLTFVKKSKVETIIDEEESPLNIGYPI